jgi:hypothetical protein
MASKAEVVNRIEQIDSILTILQDLGAKRVEGDVVF